MRILNAGQNYRVVGGSDRYMVTMGEMLKRHGHEVIPFAAKNPNNIATDWDKYFPSSLDFDSPAIKDIPKYFYSMEARKKMDELTRDFHFDLAHLHIYYGKLTTSILDVLKDKKIPIIQTVHEYKVFCPTYLFVSNQKVCTACKGENFWHVVEKRCNRGSLARSLVSCAESYLSTWNGAIKKIDHFIAVSHFQRNIYIEMGMPPEKITALPHGIDITSIQPDYTPGNYVLFFGRIERVKGIFTFLEAAKRSPQMQFVIAGNGEAIPEVRDFIQQNQLHNVQLAGWQSGENLETLIKRSLCVVLPSEWYETFGLTVIEAMARGKPVVVSDMGAMKEIVNHESDGYIFPAGKADILAEILQTFSSDTHRVETMGKLARKKIETHFTEEKHYQGLMNIYQKVLG